MKTYRIVATVSKRRTGNPKQVIPYSPRELPSNESSLSSDSDKSQPRESVILGHDVDRSMGGGDKKPLKDEKITPTQQACPRSLLEAILSLADQYPDTIPTLNPLTQLLIQDFALIFTPAFEIKPSSKTATNLIDLAKHMADLKAHLDTLQSQSPSPLATIPYWRDIDIAIQFRLGILRYQTQDFAASEACFEKIETDFALDDYAETRMATFYKGMSQLKQHQESDGLATMRCYFERQYQVKNGKLLVTAPVFPANIPQAQQRDYALTLVELWSQPPLLSRSDRFRCGGAERRQARTWTKLLAIGEHALTIASAHDLPISASDPFWTQMETAYMGLKRYGDLLLCLDHLPETATLVLKKFTIALYIPTATISPRYIADGIIAQGPNDTTSPLAKKHRITLFDQCEKHIQTPEHPLHDDAILAFGRWFCLSHHTGQQIHSGHILSCGDVVDSREYREHQTHLPLYRPKAPCPCCHEKVSITHTYTQQIRNRCQSILAAYREPETIHLVAKSMVFLNFQDILKNEARKKTRKYEPQALLATFITTLAHTQTDPNMQSLTWIRQSCLGNTAMGVASRYEMVRQHCLESLFLDSLSTVLFLGQIDDDVLSFFWESILKPEDRVYMNRAVMGSGDALQIERMKTLLRCDFTTTSIGQTLMHDAFQRFGKTEDTHWVAIITQLWDHGHCPNQMNAHGKYPLELVPEHSRAMLIAVILTYMTPQKAYEMLISIGHNSPEIFKRHLPLGTGTKPLLIQCLFTPQQIQNNGLHNGIEYEPSFLKLLHQSLEKSSLLALLKVNVTAITDHQDIICMFQDTLYRRILKEVETPGLAERLADTRHPYMTGSQWVSVLESPLFPAPTADTFTLVRGKANRPFLDTPPLLQLGMSRAGEMDAWIAEAITTQSWTAIDKLMVMGGWYQHHSLAVLHKMATLTEKDMPLLQKILRHLQSSLSESDMLSLSDLHMLKDLTRDSDLTAYFLDILSIQYQESLRPLIDTQAFGLAVERLSVSRERECVALYTEAWPSLIGANLAEPAFSPEHQSLITSTIVWAGGPLTSASWEGITGLSEKASEILKTAIASRFERRGYGELPAMPRTLINHTQWHAYLVSDAQISAKIAAEIRNTPDLLQALIPLVLNTTTTQLHGLLRLISCFSEQTQLITQILAFAIPGDHWTAVSKLMETKGWQQAHTLTALRAISTLNKEKHATLKPLIQQLLRQLQNSLEENPPLSVSDLQSLKVLIEKSPEFQHDFNNCLNFQYQHSIRPLIVAGEFGLALERLSLSEESDRIDLCTDAWPSLINAQLAAQKFSPEHQTLIENTIVWARGPLTPESWHHIDALSETAADILKTAIAARFEHRGYDELPAMPRTLITHTQWHTHVVSTEISAETAAEIRNTPELLQALICLILDTPSTQTKALRFLESGFVNQEHILITQILTIALQRNQIEIWVPVLCRYATHFTVEHTAMLQSTIPQESLWNAMNQAYIDRRIAQISYAKLLASLHKWTALRTLTKQNRKVRFEAGIGNTIIQNPTPNDKEWRALFEYLESDPRFMTTGLFEHYVNTTHETPSERGKRITTQAALERLPEGTLRAYIAISDCPEGSNWATEMVGTGNLDLVIGMLDANPAQLYQFTDTGQTPLHRCCRCVELLRGDDPRLTEKRSAFSDIFNHLRGRIHQRNADQTIHFNLSSQAVALIVSLSNMLTHTLESIGLADQSREQLYLWSAMLQRLLLIETYQFTNDLPLNPISSDVLATLIGDSFIATSATTLSHDPIKSVAVFQEFLAFLREQLDTETNPLKDFDIPLGPLTKATATLARYTRTLREIKANQETHLYRCLAKIPGEIIAKNITSSLNPELAKWLHGYQSRSLSEILSHPYFETRRPSDFRALATALESSENSLFEKSFFQNLLRHDPNYLAAEMDFIQTQWQILSATENTEIVIPSGYWAANAQQNAPHHSLSILRRRGNVLHIFHVNSGAGSEYHSGVRSTTTMIADQEDLFEEKHAQVTIAEKQKRLPFISKKAAFVANTPVPSWFVLMCQTQLIQKNSGGNYFQASHFYDVVWPTVAGTPDIPDEAKLEAMSKTTARSATSAFGLIKNTMFHHVLAEGADEGIYAQPTATLMSRHKAHKRVMSLFYLWLGSQIQRQFSEAAATEAMYTSALLGLELSNKITSNCMKQLQHESAAKHVPFLIAQAQKIGTSLTTEANRMLQHTHTVVPFDLSPRFGSGFDFPIFPKLPSGRSVGARPLPATSTPHPIPTDSNWSHLLAYTEVVQTWLADPSLQSSHVRIPSTIVAIESWTLSLWETFADIESRPVSDPVLIALAKAVHTMSETYYTVIEQQKYLLKNAPQDPFYYAKTMLTHCSLARMALICLRQHSEMGPLFQNHYFVMDAVGSYGENPDTLIAKLVIPHPKWQAVASGCNAFLDTEKNNRTALFGTDLQTSILQSLVTENAREEIPFVAIVDAFISGSEDLRQRLYTYNDRIQHNQRLRHAYIIKEPPLPILKEVMRCVQYAVLANDTAPSAVTSDTQRPHFDLHLTEKEEGVLIFIAARFWNVANLNTPHTPSHQTLTTASFQPIFHGTGKNENTILTTKETTPDGMDLAVFQHLRLLPSNTLQQRMERIKTCLQTGELNLEDAEQRHLMSQLLWEFGKLAQSPIADLCQNQPQLFVGIAKVLISKFDKRLQLRGMMAADSVAFVAETLLALRAFAPGDIQAYLDTHLHRIRQWLLEIAASAETTVHHRSAAVLAQLISGFHLQDQLNSREELHLLLSAMSRYTKSRNLGEAVAFTGLVAEPLESSKSRRLLITLTQTMTQLHPAITAMLQEDSNLLSTLAEDRGLNLPENPIWTQSESPALWTCGPHAINAISGHMYTDGYPIGSLPEDILRHADYEQYFGKARFEVQRSTELNTYYSLTLAHRYRFRHDLSITDPVDIRGSVATYKGQQYRQIAEWESHEKPVGEALSKIKNIANKAPHQFKVYTHKHHYLFVDKPYIFLAEIQDKPKTITQVRYDAGLTIEVPVYAQNAYLYKGPLNQNTRTTTQQGYATFARQADHVPGKPISIEKENPTDRTWQRAVSKWMLETQLPGHMVEVHPERESQAWASPTEIIISTPKRRDIALRLRHHGRYTAHQDTRLFGNIPLDPQTHVRLSYFENPNYICIESVQDIEDEEVLTAETLRFPRLGLSFAYRPDTFVEDARQSSGTWLSNDINGYQLATVQDLVLWKGFKSYLVLTPKDATPDTDGYKKTPFKVIIPNIGFHQHNFAEKLRHSIVMFDHRKVHDPSYIVVTYDPLTHRFRTDAVLGKLMLAFAFFATASLEKSPYTGLNGYEMAAEILRECTQNKPFSFIENEILFQICHVGDQHRNAHAIRLLAVALSRGSTALPSFFPGSDQVDLGDIQADYQAYLSKEQRIDETCKLSVAELQSIQITCQSTTQEATRIDAMLSSIPRTNFQQAIATVIQLGGLTFEIHPRLWAWDAQKHAVSDLFVSLLSEIIKEDAARDDIRYALRFLALSKQLTEAENVLLKMLHLLNTQPSIATRITIPHVLIKANTTPKDCLLTATQLYQCIPYDDAINRAAVKANSSIWLEIIGEKWQSPFGRGMAPIENFQDAIEAIAHMPEFSALPESLRSRMVSSFKAWVTPLYQNRVAADFMTALASTCDQIKAMHPDHTLVTSKTIQTRLQRENATLSGINPAGIVPLDRPPIEGEFTTVLADIMRLLDPKKQTPNSPQTMEAALHTVKSRLAQDHPKHAVRQSNSPRINTGFPLADIAATHQEAQAIYKRLQNSWEAYHRLPNVGFSLVNSENTPGITQVETVKAQLEQQSKHWQAAAQKLEAWITGVANQVRDDPEGWKFMVAQMQGRAMLTAKDNLKLLNNPDTLDSRNPFLKNIKTLLLDAVLLFAEIETHGQHLQRCIAAAKAVIQNVAKSAQTGDDLKLRIAYSQFCQTLSTERSYDPQRHPEYLLFELENSLLVRDKQLAMTALMLTANRVLGQMNMGEGKSSVVMLLILIGLAKKGKLTRVIVPEPLMADMERLIRTRIGSPFETLVYVFPFHRNLIEHITVEEIHTLYHQVKHCKDHRHVILMTPDHALSLRLNLEEAIVQRNARETPSPRLDTLIRVLRHVASLLDMDILDEGDAILSLITETNYTLGSRVAIDGSPIRQQVAIGFFHTLLFDPEIQVLLQTTPGFVRRHIGRASQLILQQESAYTPALRRAVAAKCIQDAFPQKSPQEKSQYLEFVISDTATMDPFGQNRGLNERDKSHLRTLRCWCRPDVLGYVLGQRYRVEYGLFEGTENDYKNQAIDRFAAVPYRGKDTPVPTSTFEHPDVRIGFTVLSYFYRGLREADMQLTLKHLSAAYNTRATTFEGWVQTAQIPTSIHTWNSLHLDNPAHIATLTQSLSHHPDVVAYYLTHIVFADTSNFPQKIGADGSALVQGHENTGMNAFSGTTTMAIPIGMDPNFYAHIPEAQRDTFLATDAQTLVHFANPAVISVRHTALPAETEALLDTLVTRLQVPGSRIMALLDPGALITGLSNKEVAETLILKTNAPEVSPLVRSRMQGVVYFDDVTDEVMVAKRDSNGTICQPLSVCDFKKKHLFTYFNDIKTRGIDRKLPILSQGIMTIGKDMTTDQLVQAAMRLRQLGQGQQLELWIPNDVLGQIRHFMSTHVPPDLALSPVIVYAWTIANTFKKETDALRSQADKHQRAMRKAPALTTNLPSAALIEASGLGLDYYDAGIASPIRLNSKQQVQMSQRAETQVKVQTETRDHVRPNHKTRTARTEHPWQYENILTPYFFNMGRSGFDKQPHPTLKCKSVGELFFGSRFQEEAHVLNQVHVSQNFWEVATQTDSIPDLLRPADAYLEIKDSENRIQGILVSGKEAAAIKAVLQSEAGQKTETHVVLRQLYDPVGETCLYAGTHLDTTVLSEEQQTILILLMLVNGDSGFLHSDIGNALGTDERETEARSLAIMSGLLQTLAPTRRVALANTLQHIQTLRGKSSRFEGSPLATVFKAAGVS